MADVKISGLPASTTPLAGTEVLPIVQGGVTKQVSVANLTDGRNVTVGAGTVSAPAITTTGDTNTGVFFPAADTIAFTEGGVESMRADSNRNLGVGTAAPAARLQVTRSFADSTIEEIARFSRIGGTAGGTNRAAAIVFSDASSLTLTAAVAGVRDNSGTTFNGSLALYTNNTGGSAATAVSQLTERMRITAAGNVGIGLTNAPVKFAISDNDIGSYAGFSFTRSSPNFFTDITAQGQVAGWQGIMRFFVGNEGVAATERMRIDNTGNLSIANGNVIISTSGKGIDFSATAGTGTSELLNDYEEGTFTPGIAFGGAAVGVTYSTQTGIYTKIGRCVVFTVNIVLTSKGSSTGNLTVTNLPFTSGATHAYGTSFGDWYDFNFLTVSPLYAKVNPSNTNVSMFRQASASFVQAITDAEVQNNTQFKMSGYYFV